MTRKEKYIESMLRGFTPSQWADMTWLVIRALAAVGLATDVHLLPKNAERFRIRQKEEPELAPVAA